MDYTLERFNLDMRKVNLFAETAYSEYAFTVEETFMDESVNDYEVEAVIAEAAGGLLSKIKAAFAKIIESIKKFFTNLIEKVKNFFAGNKEEKLKKMVSDNPALAKQKVQVPNIKEIEEVCGKRAILRKKMIAEYEKGTLTRDKFDKMLEDSEKLGKRLKTVGVITVAIGAIVGGAFGFSKLNAHLKDKKQEACDDVNGIAYMRGKTGFRMDPSQSTLTYPTRPSDIPRRDVAPDAQLALPVNGVELASKITSMAAEDERTRLQAQLQSVTACRDEALKVLRHMNNETTKHLEVINNFNAAEDRFRDDQHQAYQNKLRNGVSEKQAKREKHDAILSYLKNNEEAYNKASIKFSKAAAHAMDKSTELEKYNEQIADIRRKLGR